MRRMGLNDLRRPESVRSAMAECDAIGREPFLAKYGFRKSRTYLVLDGPRFYDSKPLLAAAHGVEHRDLGPLSPDSFSGGDDHAAAVLRRLGFDVIALGRDIPAPAPTWPSPPPILLY